MIPSTEPVKLFIGQDDVESVAYYTYEHSVHQLASLPVTVTPLRLSQLKGLFEREWHPKQSNEFAFSRWLVPYLCGFKGWAIFTDCDMLIRADIAELWALRDWRYSVQVVQHPEYIPVDAGDKFLGRPQTPYERKNWSSVMMFNCAHYHCRKLTPDHIQEAEGLDLHQFKWTTTARIGALPAEWNHLVGEQEHKDAKLVHYTRGGPWFEEFADCDYHQDWFNAFQSMTHCNQRKKQVRAVK